LATAVASTITTSDGRTLAFCEWGERDGQPVFALHGTPGSRLTRHPDEEVYRRAGVRAITYDRPGYGRSTRRPSRQVADAAADVAAIADALGWGEFAVEGGSGGGPHSLACAALLPRRVTRCACVVGVAPLGDDGLPRDKWTEGMVEGNVREFGWALEGEETLRRELAPLAAELLQSVESDPENPLGASYALSAEDLDVMAEGAFRAMLADSFREGIGRTIDGIIDDDLAFMKPWGFDLGQIRCPTTVAYGPQDTLVPTSHGEWLARHIPDARTVVLDGGHLAIYHYLPELLAWLTGVDA
jgi:pimeloyl-ACP methyl ester carboxylesterase